MDEKERIDKIMQKEEMTAAVFASEIGIQGSTLSHILNGRNNPSLDVLKKILNRFRTISSDWLILGVGSMYRIEKQSQTLSLFEDMDESDSKSVVSDQKNGEKTQSIFETIQQKKQIVSDTGQKQPHSALDISVQSNESNSKTVRKIIVYYNDNTFQEFETK